MISFFISSFQKWVFPQKSLTDGNKASVRSADRDADRTLVTSSRHVLVFNSPVSFILSVLLQLDPESFITMCTSLCKCVCVCVCVCVQAVPFRGPITGGMQPGKKVVVVGVVDPRPDR